MTRPTRQLVFTTAKARVAALWSTLAALQVFLGLLLTVLDDDAVGADEVTPLITGIVTMAITVWRVWRVPNMLVQNNSSSQSQV